MKKVIKFLKLLITAFLLAALASSIFAVYVLNNTPDVYIIDENPNVIETSYVVKNVIIMIGDGMGENHIEATRRYFGLEQLNMEKLPYKGYVKTSCILFGEEFPITDKALKAIKLATGYKTQIGMIGTDLIIINLMKKCSCQKTF